MKIRKGDRVQVLTGKDRGKEGEVMTGPPRATTRSSSTASTSPSGTRSPTTADAAGRHHRQGHADRRVQRRDHLHSDGKATRVGYRFERDGTKIRICTQVRR